MFVTLMSIIKHKNDKYKKPKDKGQSRGGDQPGTVENQPGRCFFKVVTGGTETKYPGPPFPLFKVLVNMFKRNLNSSESNHAI